MTYQEFKQKVDALWEKFWTGGITNPLSVIEQITYLIFLKMLDEQEDKKARTAKLTHKPYKTNFPNFKINPFDKNSPKIKGEDVRWRNLRQKSGDDLLNTMRDKVFPFLKQCDFSNTKAGAYLKDAYLLINKPSLLSAAINDIDDLPLEQDDIKGNLYEYLLTKIEIDNYKAFNGFVMRLCPQEGLNLNLLIGRNGSGKSSFLDALAEIGCNNLTSAPDKSVDNTRFKYTLTLNKKDKVNQTERNETGLWDKVVRFYTG